MVSLWGVGGCHFHFNEDEGVTKAAESRRKSQVQVAEPSLAAALAGDMRLIAVRYQRGVTEEESDL